MCMSSLPEVASHVLRPPTTTSCTCDTFAAERVIGLCNFLLVCAIPGLCAVQEDAERVAKRQIGRK